jgi:predicted DNA-binding transcriptional regulator AlpA
MGLHVFPGALVMSAHEGHNQAAAQPKLKSKIAAIARQATRIGELGGALVADGLVTLDDQARALGLSRSTAWAVLKANHKATGLTAATIDRMLTSPELPPRVRATILTYVEEKLAGHYGHNKNQLRRFAAGSLFAGNVLVATFACIIVTLIH